MARQSNIMRRGNAWVVRFRRDGREHWRSFKARDDAELYWSRELDRRSRGLAPERRVDVGFEEAAEAWFSAGVTRGWRPSTRRDYRSVLDAHLLPAFRERRLVELTAAVVSIWRDEQVRSGLSRRTASKLLAVLHGIAEHARKLYGLTVNHVAEVDRIPEDPPAPLDFYSPEECWALVRAAESDQDAAIFLTAAFAGLRRGELIALRVRDVDFARRTIRVEGSYAHGELTLPKSGRVRAVPLAAEVATALARLLDGRGDPGPDELLFPGDGGHLDGSALRRRYAKAQRLAGLRPLRFHDLRHVFGSTAINRASIVQVQAWMGHADVKTTMRYLHHKSHDAEAELLDGAFAIEPAVALVAS
jgi:integrase